MCLFANCSCSNTCICIVVLSKLTFVFLCVSFLSPLPCRWQFAQCALWLKRKAWESAKLAGVLLMLFIAWNVYIQFDYHTWCFKTKNGGSMPQRLIIGKPISQYTSYAAMFCPLHSSISIEQHKKYLFNPSSHYEDSLVMRTPQIMMGESHNTSISAIDEFHIRGEN